MKFSNLTIRTKLMAGAGVIIASSLAVIVIGGTSLMSNAARSEAEAQARALMSSYTEMVEGEFSSLIGTARGLSAAVEGTIEHAQFSRDQLGEMVKAVVSSNPALTGMTLAFEPNALDGNDALHIGHPYSDATGRFVPYFTNSENGLQTELLDMSPENGTESWYDMPLRENRDLVTPPYAYPVNGQSILLSTFTEIIRKNDNPIGILTADLSLDTIGRIIGEMKPFGTGRIMLVSHDTQWVAHWDPAQVGQMMPPEFAAGMLSEAMVTTGQSYIDPTGTELFAIASRVKFPGVSEEWTLIMEIPAATIYASINETRNLALIASVVLLIITLALVRLGAGMIAKPIVRMTGVMRELTEGKYDIEVPYRDGGDEIGGMARAVEVFRENGLKISQMTEAEAARIIADEQSRRDMMTDLQAAFGEVVDAAIAGDFSKRVHSQFPDPELNGLAGSINSLVETVDRGIGETGVVLGALARTDLTVRMSGDYRGAFAKLKEDANAVAETLSDVVSQLKHTSQSIKTATGELLSGANDLSERTTKQAATIEQTSAAMEQLAHTVVQSADRARDANQDAQLVTRTAEEGGEVMTKATLAMTQISTSSAKISNIIGLIDDIAFQTNLLALNASVEAARAGDAGKGFAVVAVEVRRLAQSAAQASSDVKALIEASANEVTVGTRLVDEAAGKLASMVEAAKSNSRLMDSIARDSREQASAIEEVTIAVRQMDEMTQHNAALVEETNAAIEQTEAQANELDRVVAVFRTDARARTSAAAPAAPAAPAARPQRRNQPSAAQTYLSRGNTAVNSDWDEF
ncbi:methyl-accepting chemotaxis protein [Devosia sp. WQ 349K1]|uniref:methyl-accepting chemotaxis protein n=1 Tax=Devosia sp. WQ 349K1 TaxID=2800329 RepID=UPI0020B19D87|nr:methyl-accepting chemotaxis protein [Devosia sp. WQ 349K1]